MTEIVVVLPVLGRPEYAAEVHEQLMGAMTDGVQYRPLFVCTDTDAPQLAACRATGADTLVGPEVRWAAKLNAALRATDEPWLFTGADDLCFCTGWADKALEVAGQTGCGVIGTNDLNNPRVTAGTHSTHSLVARWYAVDHGTVDELGLVAHEGYVHQFADDELVQTAFARQSFVSARSSWVEHLHPNWGHGRWDATYQIGQDGLLADQALFEERQEKWLRLERVPVRPFR